VVVVVSVVVILLIILIVIVYVKFRDRICISEYTQANGQFFTDVVVRRKIIRL